MLAKLKAKAEDAMKWAAHSSEKLYNIISKQKDCLY